MRACMLRRRRSVAGSTKDRVGLPSERTMESVALSKVAPQPSLSGVVVLCAWKFDVWYQNALPLFHVSCNSLRDARRSGVSSGLGAHRRRSCPLVLVPEPSPCAMLFCGAASSQRAHAALTTQHGRSRRPRMLHSPLTACIHCLPSCLAPKKRVRRGPHETHHKKP